MALSNAGFLVDFLFKESIKKTESQKINDLRVSVVEIETLVSTLQHLVRRHKDEHRSEETDLQNTHANYLESLVRKLDHRISDVSGEIDRKISTLLTSLHTISGVAGASSGSQVLSADKDLLMSFRALPLDTDTRSIAQKCISDFKLKKTTVIELLSYVLFGELRAGTHIFPGPIGTSISFLGHVKTGATIINIEFDFCYPVIFQSVLGTLPEVEKLRLYALDVTSNSNELSSETFLQSLDTRSATSSTFTLSTLKMFKKFKAVMSVPAGQAPPNENEGETLNFNTQIISQSQNGKRKYLVALGTIDAENNLNSLSNIIEIEIDRISAPDVFTSPDAPTINTINSIIKPDNTNLIDRFEVACDVGGGYILSNLTRDVVGSGTVTRTITLSNKDSFGVSLASSKLNVSLKGKFNFVDGVETLDETMDTFSDDTVSMTGSSAVSDFLVEVPRYGRKYVGSLQLRNNKTQQFSARSVEKEFDNLRVLPAAKVFNTLEPLTLNSSSVNKRSALHLTTLVSTPNVVCGDNVSGQILFDNIQAPFLNETENTNIILPIRSATASLDDFFINLESLFKNVSISMLMHDTTLITVSKTITNIRSQDDGNETKVFYANGAVTTDVSNSYGRLLMTVENIDSYSEAESQKFFNTMKTVELKLDNIHQLRSFDLYRNDGLYTFTGSVSFHGEMSNLPLFDLEPKCVHGDGSNLQDIRTGGPPLILDNFFLKYDIFDISSDNLNTQVANKTQVISGYPIFKQGCIPWTVSYSGFNETYGVNPVLSYSIIIGGVIVGEYKVDMGAVTQTLYRYHSDKNETSSPSTIYSTASESLKPEIFLSSVSSDVPQATTLSQMKSIGIVQPARPLVGLIAINNTNSFAFDAGSATTTLAGTEKTKAENPKYNLRYEGCTENKLKAGILQEASTSHYLSRPIRFTIINEFDATTGDVFANGTPGNQYVTATRASNLTGDSSLSQIPVTNNAMRVDSRSIAYGTRILQWNSTPTSIDKGERPAKVLMSHNTIRATLSQGLFFEHNALDYTHQLLLSRGKWTHTNHSDFPSVINVDCEEAGDILFGQYRTMSRDNDYIQRDLLDNANFTLITQARENSVNLMKSRSGEDKSVKKHVTFVFENILGSSPSDINYIKVFSKNVYEGIDTGHNKTSPDDLNINISSSDVDVIVGFIKKDPDPSTSAYVLLSQLYNAKSRSDEIPPILNDQADTHNKMQSLAQSYTDQDFGNSSNQYTPDVVQDGEVVSDNLRGIRPASGSANVQSGVDNLVNFVVEKPVDLNEACDMFVRIQLNATSTQTGRYNPSTQVQIGHLFAASFESEQEITF